MDHLCWRVFFSEIVTSGALFKILILFFILIYVSFRVKIALQFILEIHFYFISLIDPIKNQMENFKLPSAALFSFNFVTSMQN